MSYLAVILASNYKFELEIIFKQIDSCQKSYAGFLIYGPSGSGKSLLAQAIISKLEGYKLIQINGSEVFRWVLLKFLPTLEQNLSETSIMDCQLLRQKFVK